MKAYNRLSMMILPFVLVILGGFVTGINAQQPPDVLENQFVNATRQVSPAVVRITVERKPFIGEKPIPLPRFYRNPEEEKSGEYYFDMDTSYWDELQKIEPKLRRLIPPEFPYYERLYPQGTGMIISPDGYILTAYHLVENAGKINVQIPDGKKYSAELVGTKPSFDLALLKIKGAGFPTVQFGESESLKMGQWAITVGYPLEDDRNSNTPSITIGHIGGLKRSLPELTEIPVIQIDARIVQGYGGGPVINLKGLVIGMIIAKSGRISEGIGYALPITRIQPIIGEMKENKPTVLAGWLGVGISDVTDKMIRDYKLPSRKGTFVTRVYPNSPADIAKIRVNDVILRFGNRDIENSNHLRRLVSETPIGEKITIHLYRNGQIISVTVRIESKEDTMIIS